MLEEADVFDVRLIFDIGIGANLPAMTLGCLHGVVCKMCSTEGCTWVRLVWFFNALLY